MSSGFGMGCWIYIDLEVATDAECPILLGDWHYGSSPTTDLHLSEHIFTFQTLQLSCQCILYQALVLAVKTLADGVPSPTGEVVGSVQFRGLD